MSQTRADTHLTDASPSSDPAAEPVELICSEVWGGNRETRTEVKIPGLNGFVYSRPCDGAQGGDVHYLTTCTAGALSRVCLADVVGHGQTVSRVSGWLHQLLRKHMSAPDPRRILQGLNVRLAKEGLAAMTTAACVSYDAPRGELTYCYAGHPPAWLYRRADDAWSELLLSRGTPELLPETPENVISNLPLGVRADSVFERASTALAPGDRLFLFSDGVPETPDPNQDLLGVDRVHQCLTEHRHAAVPDIAQAILDRLFEHAGANSLAHDDVTMVLLEIGQRLQGNKMVRMLKSQMRKLLGR